jgi:CheY-like chemotaxis protein
LAAECPLKVLVAEDNQLTSLVAQKMFAQLGFPIHSLSNPDLAASALIDGTPHASPTALAPEDPRSSPAARAKAAVDALRLSTKCPPVVAQPGPCAVFVSDGLLALKTAAAAVQNQVPFDLIILDGRMPGLDGLSTAIAIRLCAGSKPAIWAMTADTLSAPFPTSSAVNGALEKPVMLPVLRVLVKDTFAALARH